MYTNHVINMLETIARRLLKAISKLNHELLILVFPPPLSATIKKPVIKSDNQARRLHKW